MEEVKEKKLRIVMLASEFNLSAEQLIEFLKKKGYSVKTPNSLVTDEMLNDLKNHFKKDIEKAKKHQKKVEEFQKKIAKPSHEEKEKTIEEVKVEEIKSTKDSPKETKKSRIVEELMQDIESDALAAQQLEIERLKAEAEKLKAEAEKLKVKKEVAVTQEKIATPPVVEEVVVKIPVVEEIPVPQKEELSPLENVKMKGLTVLGKMDLGRKPRETTPKSTADGTPKSETATGQESTSAAASAAKKKKKKPKPKKKTEPVVEEVPATKKKQKVKKFEIDQKEVEDTIRKTLLSMDDSSLSARASSRKKKRKEKQELETKRQEVRDDEKNIITATEFMSVNELTNTMNVQVSDVIAKCISLGLMVSINQRLDVETITLVADEFGFQVEFAKEYTSEVLDDTPDPVESLKRRPPVVTIMGHVDHGKTSLLDYIRRTNVVAGESGGITQHIGAYKVELPEGGTITFLDTPGHAAFTAMRARGAQATDIVILVVAADDAVMPTTLEAINHSQAANVPIIVAINKIDKHTTNIDKIKQQLGDRNILVEEWGGKHQCVELSAKTGKNVDVLLEKILLEAEVLDLRANPDRLARGIVIESELDKGRGNTATILVQKGSLKVGDPFISGIHFGRVRAMFDERNRKVSVAGPCTPVLVLGFEGSPQAGDSFICVDNERAAREIALKRQQLKREQEQKQVHHITLDEISRQISIGGVKELPIIVKGDVDGSVEALSDSLMKLSTQEVIIKVIHRGVGAISESDVLLAAASNAIIIGFHVRPNLNARKLAETQKVDVRLYSIIYNAINEVKSALEGLLSPILSEEVTASVEVRDVFKVSKVGAIAGCFVQEGKIQRNNNIRLVRNGIVIFDGDISSLKRFKDDVREVDSGYECGISIHNYNDIKIGDIIEAYKVIETKKKLE